MATQQPIDPAERSRMRTRTPMIAAFGAFRCQPPTAERRAWRETARHYEHSRTFGDACEVAGRSLD